MWNRYSLLGLSLLAFLLITFGGISGVESLGPAPAKIVEGQKCGNSDQCDPYPGYITKLFCDNGTCQCPKGNPLEGLPLETSWYLPWGRCVSDEGSLCERVDDGYGFICEPGVDCYPIPNVKRWGVCGSCVVKGSVFLLFSTVAYFIVS